MCMKNLEEAEKSRFKRQGLTNRKRARIHFLLTYPPLIKTSPLPIHQLKSNYPGPCSSNRSSVSWSQLNVTQSEKVSGTVADVRSGGGLLAFLLFLDVN